MSKLQEWNKIAFEHAAFDIPYSCEFEMHRQMIDYGEEQVEKVPPREIVFKGLSITRLRYLKAAFIYAASSREEEIGHITATGTWPDRSSEPSAEKLKAS